MLEFVCVILCSNTKVVILLCALGDTRFSSSKMCVCAYAIKFHHHHHYSLILLTTILTFMFHNNPFSLSFLITFHSFYLFWGCPYILIKLNFTLCTNIIRTHARTLLACTTQHTRIHTHCATTCLSVTQRQRARDALYFT